MLDILLPAMWNAADNPALTIAAALALMMVASFLVFLELIILSAGLLSLLALAAGTCACYLGFEAGPAAGWSLIIMSPICTIFAIRLGLQLMQHSSHMVPKAEIEADAGYHHVATAAGVVIGSIGTLVSDAMPTGKAKFGQGHVNVVVQGSAGDQGDSIKVIKIDGPSIEVVIIKDPQSTEENIPQS
ncbi:MAG: hypothetical protein HRU15_17320 [Planctomycetes bacterium]|nr:hypothetical protein [Planctomycetota bacterium]